MNCQFKWTDDQLTEVVNKRLEVISRGAYTKAPPQLKDFLPHGRAKKRVDAREYILQRTLRRPRDLLDFLNTCVQVSGALETLTWSTIRKAEIEYSVRRFKALVEEWKGTYDGMERVLIAVRPLGKCWTVAQLSDDILDAALASEPVGCGSWLSELGDRYLAGTDFARVRTEMVNMLVEVGFLVPSNGLARFADASDPMLSASIGPGYSSVIVHKMFWGALGYSDETDGAGRTTS